MQEIMEGFEDGMGYFLFVAVVLKIMQPAEVYGGICVVKH